MLYWIDIETTGLDPERDVILEIGCTVTDDHLNVVATMPDMLVSTPASRLERMDTFVQDMHERSGLSGELRAGGGNHINLVAQRVRAFIVSVPDPNKRVLAGSSVHFDRTFLKKHMPKVDELFIHRHADCSALREYAMRWMPEVQQRADTMLHPARAHRPALDLIDSITLAKFYKDHIFTKETN